MFGGDVDRRLISRTEKAKHKLLHLGLMGQLWPESSATAGGCERGRPMPLVTQTLLRRMHRSVATYRRDNRLSRIHRGEVSYHPTLQGRKRTCRQGLAGCQSMHPSE